ncbi:hypothetical protein AB0M44_28550 [Streptosporangium subroseum]|uniref:hypothetical protein n=1 Tax=Streptosporangium subroseum TaxID=106412 RepID=UPI003421DFE0
MLDQRHSMKSLHGGFVCLAVGCVAIQAASLPANPEEAAAAFQRAWQNRVDALSEGSLNEADTFREVVAAGGPRLPHYLPVPVTRQKAVLVPPPSTPRSIVFPPFGVPVNAVLL